MAFSSFPNSSLVTQFTGKERDKDYQNNNDYFGARYYDSRIANWTSIDPLFEKYIDYSPYNYVLRNPIIFFDANGEDLWGTSVNKEQISKRLNKDWITYDPKTEKFGVKIKSSKGLDKGDKELYDLITKSDYNVELRSMNRPVQVTPEGQRELFIGGGEGFGINQDGKNIWVKPIYLPDIRKMDVSGIKSEDETIRHEAIEGKYQRMGQLRKEAHKTVNDITGEVEISTERKNLGNGEVLLQIISLSGVTPFYIYNSQEGTYREP